MLIPPDVSLEKIYLRHSTSMNLHPILAEKVSGALTAKKQTIQTPTEFRLNVPIDPGDRNAFGNNRGLAPHEQP